MMNKRMIIIESYASNSEINGEKLSKHFSKNGWSVDVVSDFPEVKSLLVDGDFYPDIIFIDLDISENEILKDCVGLKQLIGYTEFIFSYDPRSDIDISYIDKLAYDILEKPFDIHCIEVVVNHAQQLSSINRHLRHSSVSTGQRYLIESYLGESDAAKNVRDMLSALTETDISAVTVVGETGTGKGLVARIIHHRGLRSNGPLVEINCAALPKELLESQLFGHEAGAFTGAKSRRRGLFEQAHGGTLFLDEIGDMDIELQSKLLKALEDKKARRLGGEIEINFDVQIIAATGVDLEKAMNEGRFREDLYHRLTVFSIDLPPLVDRKEDLIDLVPSIINEYNHKANKKVTRVTKEVWERLFNYSWTGNIRELRNVIERSVLLSKDETFPSKWLQLNSSSDVAIDNIDTFRKRGSAITIPLDGSMKLEQMDSVIIQAALEDNEYNVSQTAVMLGSTRETLRYRIQKYDLKDRG